MRRLVTDKLIEIFFCVIHHRLHYVLACLITAQIATAQTPTLIKDIGTSITELGKPSGLITYEGYIYFSKYSQEHGEELWRSDGTTTELFADIYAGANSSSPADFAIFNGELYFKAQSVGSSSSPSDLWKTDGTTTVLVKPSVNPSQLTVAATSLFFVGHENYTGYELWKSDGTTEGTVLVKNIASGNYSPGIRELTAVGDDVFFVATEYPVSTYPDFEVWFSDGTEAGTIKLEAVASTSNSTHPTQLTEFGGKLYYVAFDGVGSSSGASAIGNKSLFVSDGTPAGTAAVTSIFGFASTAATEIPIYKTPSALYYWDNNFGSKRLYSYDGSTSTLLKTFDNSIWGVYFRGNFDDVLYVVGPNAGGSSVASYSVSGGVVSPSLVIVTADQNGVALNGSYYYPSEYKMFVTNGDDASITEIENLTNGLAIKPSGFVTLGSDIFFLAGDNTEHTQLWKTDGTANAAVRLTEKGFISNQGSSPNTFIVLNDKLYFNTSGNAIYETDGTEPNTTQAIAASSIKEGGVVLNGEYYYSLGNNFTDKLMKTDGTIITEVFGIDRRITNLTVSGSHIFFTSTTNSEEMELWVTDGTVGNKTMLDLASGGTFSSYPTQLTDIGGELYFTAIDLNSGTRGIWRTDGTLPGSEVVDSDVGYNIMGFKTIGDNLYYVVDDLLIGKELKTYNVQSDDLNSFDLNAGAADANPDKLTIFDNKIYFVATVNSQKGIYAVSGNSSPELVRPLPGANSIGDIAAGHGFISFLVSYYAGNIIYVMDREGQLVIPSNTYLSSFYSTSSTVNAWSINNITYFVSNGSLVETDGTDAGTRLVVSSIGMKQDQSSIPEAVVFDNELYFVYDDGLIGKELYKYKSDLQDFELFSASDLVFDQINGTELSISLTNGSGDGRAILISANTPARLPKNIAYTSNPVFGESPLEAGSTTFIVLNSSESTITVSGLTPGTEYHIAVVEYTEDSPGDFRYDRQHILRGSFEMEKSDQTITAEDIVKTFGDSPFPLGASASSGLSVVYTYVSGPGQLSAGNLTITGAGEIVIAVTQPGNSEYNAAPSEEMIVTVAKADWPIVFPTVDPELVYSPDIDIDLTFYNNVVYEVTEGTANIGGGLSSGFFDIRNVNAGTITITATRLGDANHNETTDELTFNVAKADQLISYTEQEDTEYLTESVLIDAMSDSGLPITITIVEGPVTLIGSELVFTGVGTVDIELSQPGNVNYNPAEVIEDSFIISPSDQVITFDIPEEVPYSTQTFPLVITTNSGQSAVVSIISGKGTIIGANPQYMFSSAEDATGEVTIEAVVGTGGGLFNLAVEQFSFTVVKGENVISFEASDMTYTATPVELTVSSNSTLPVILTQTGGTGEVTFSDNEMSIVTAGTIEVTATQSGNTNWNAAEVVTKTFTISKADQSIVFNPGNITYTPQPVPLTGATESGLPLTYQKSAGTGVVTIEGSTMTIVTAGTVELTVTQPGNVNWNAAELIVRSFTIAKATQTIDFDELDDITKTVTSVPLSASSSSGLTVSFASQSGRTAISGSSATIQSVSSGGETIIASQPGNENYEAAPLVGRSFCISPVAPTVSASGLEIGNAQLQTNNTVDAIDWYKNGTFLESKPANTVLTISDEGVYKAFAKANDGCPSSGFSNEVTLVITSIENGITRSKSYLYPNPALHELNIELNAFEREQDVQVTITDMLGRTMDARSGKGKQTITVDVQAYPAGQYLVHIKHNSNVEVGQFIKSSSY